MASALERREEDLTVRLAHRPAEGGWSRQATDLVNHTVRWFLFLSERYVLFVWSSSYFKEQFLIQTIYCPPKQAQNSGKAAPVSAQYIHWKQPEERWTAHPEPRDTQNSPSVRCCTQFDSTIGSFLVSYMWVQVPELHVELHVELRVPTSPESVRSDLGHVSTLALKSSCLGWNGITWVISGT